MQANENKDPAGISWHMDKRIPITLIMAILVQTAGGIWWARGVSAAVDHEAFEQVRLETRVTKIETDKDDLRSRLIRVEEKLSHQTDTLMDQSHILREILQNVSAGKR